MNKAQKIVSIAVAAVLLGTGSAAAGSALAAKTVPHANEVEVVEKETTSPLDPIAVMPASGVNARGQSYGGVPKETDAPRPHLVAAYATNGAVGYVYADQMSVGPDENATFEDVQAYMRDVEAGIYDGYTIPVYESDGKTIIGEYPINPA